MEEREWDEEEDPTPKDTCPENQSVQELAEEALKSEERIQRIIMNEANQ